MELYCCHDISSFFFANVLRVCYDRVPPKFVISPNMTVWILSAIWHGFYPSYYLAFICCAFINEAARKVSHHWLSHRATKCILFHILFSLLSLLPFLSLLTLLSLLSLLPPPLLSHVLCVLLTDAASITSPFSK